MTDKELEKKASEYRKELVPYTDWNYSGVALPVYDSIDIDRAFVAGAKFIINTNYSLHKAKEIIEKLLEEEKDNMYWEMNGSDKSSYYEVRKQAEQFLMEVTE